MSRRGEGLILNRRVMLPSKTNNTIDRDHFIKKPTVTLLHLVPFQDATNTNMTITRRETTKPTTSVLREDVRVRANRNNKVDHHVIKNVRTTATNTRRRHLTTRIHRKCHCVMRNLRNDGKDKITMFIERATMDRVPTLFRRLSINVRDNNTSVGRLNAPRPIIPLDKNLKDGRVALRAIRNRNRTIVTLPNIVNKHVLVRSRTKRRLKNQTGLSKTMNRALHLTVRMLRVTTDRRIAIMINLIRVNSGHHGNHHVHYAIMRVPNKRVLRMALLNTSRRVNVCIISLVLGTRGDTRTNSNVLLITGNSLTIIRGNIVLLVATSANRQNNGARARDRITKKRTTLMTTRLDALNVRNMRNILFTRVMNVRRHLDSNARTLLTKVSARTINSIARISMLLVTVLLNRNLNNKMSVSTKRAPLNNRLLLRLNRLRRINNIIEHVNVKENRRVGFRVKILNARNIGSLLMRLLMVKLTDHPITVNINAIINTRRSRRRINLLRVTLANLLNRPNNKNNITNITTNGLIENIKGSLINASDHQTTSANISSLMIRLLVHNIRRLDRLRKVIIKLLRNIPLLTNRANVKRNKTVNGKITRTRSLRHLNLNNKSKNAYNANLKRPGLTLVTTIKKITMTASGRVTTNKDIHGLR